MSEIKLEAFMLMSIEKCKLSIVNNDEVIDHLKTKSYLFKNELSYLTIILVKQF